MKAFDLTLLTIVLFVAIVTLWIFIISKNGRLRKIMIWYFIVEVFIFACLWYYLMEVEHNINFEYLLPVILIPKAIVKLFLLHYHYTKK